MGFHQYCQSCQREVSKLKSTVGGMEWKIKCEHYTMDKIDTVDAESKAMCADCFNEKKPGWRKYLYGKHFNEYGKLLLTKRQKKKYLKHDLTKLKTQRQDVNQKILRKEKELENIS